MTATSLPSVAVVGTGVIGRRLATRLLDRGHAVTFAPAVGRDRERLIDVIGPRVELPAATVPLEEAAPAVAVLCGPDETQADEARRALAAGCHVVSLADSATAADALLGLADFAAEVGRSVVVGGAASPGCSLLLSAHASTLFTSIDEIAVAVVGTAGPECTERRLGATRSDSQEWRDGDWLDCSARSGVELIWFPDPVGAVDCARGDLSEILLLRRLLPEVPTISVKAERSITTPTPRPRRPWRRGVPDAPGSVRVAVSGRAQGAPATVVYATVAPAVVATTALAARCCAAVAAAGDGRVGAVTDFLDARDALRGLAADGVRSLVFEGID